MANTFRGLLPDGALPSEARAEVQEMIEENPQLPQGGEAGQVLTSNGDGSYWSSIDTTVIWDADAQARAQGFWIIVSATEPSETTYTLSDGTSVPIIWQKPLEVLVPVIPSEPFWDILEGTAMVPAVVGVEYRTSEGVVLVPDEPIVVAATPPQTVTVEAHALPGYHLPFDMSWTFDFPDPTARTLVASSAFSVDAPTVPFAWDNELGGTATVEFNMPGSTGSLPSYRALGGMLTPNAEGTSNTYATAMYPSNNIALQFDVVSLGETQSANAVASLSGLGLRAPSRDAGGVRLTFRVETAGSPTVSGADIQLPRMAHAEQTGTWELGVFGGTAFVTTPAGDTYTGPVTADLDGQAWGSQNISVRHYALASGFQYDNFRLYEMGA